MAGGQRQALLDGDFELATELCRNMQGPYNQSYQPLGDLWIDFLHGEEVTDYRRELDLTNGLATVSYRAAGDTYRRTVFISYPDQALVLRLESSRAGGLEFDVRLDSQLRHTTNASPRGELSLSGKAPSHVDPNYLRDSENPIIYDDAPDGKGMTFAARLRVITDGGTVGSEADRLQIRKATHATVLLTAATSFNGPQRSPSRDGRDPVALAQADLAQVVDKSYGLLQETHRNDFEPLMQRVSLDLGHDADVVALPTDQRLARHGQGKADNHLEMLLFQYGRYLLVSSSRPGSQPVNLQGIWNDKIRPPWSDNWTMNINVQMSYWPAEVCNLSECHEPLFRMLQECVEPGQRSAQVFYGCGGWLTHHNVDLWRQTAPVGNHGHGHPRWANWPMGGAWTCQHLMEHYRFTGDKAFLRDQAYPLMRGAAQFCLEWLIEDGEGHLVTAPSTSPENVFLWPERDKLCSVSMASTMDMSLIWNLFSDCIDAAEILESDEEFREKLRDARTRLYPLKIGKHGQLQEWFRDWDRPEDHHRHMSHLVGFFPGRHILYHTQPELTAGVRKSLTMREEGKNVGWSVAWKICLGARLHDGQFCHEMIEQKFRRNLLPNLLGHCPPMIMDSNFGYSAGVAEMLVQSHEGEIELLPALPAAWPQGEVHGLRTRGGFEVSLAWEGGRLLWAEFDSLLGNPLQIRYGDQVRSVDDLPKGQVYRIGGDEWTGREIEEPDGANHVR